MTKILKNLDIEGTHFNIIKTINEKLTANITLKSEKLNTLPSRSGKCEAQLLLTHQYNTVLELLARDIRKKNK